MHGPGNPMQQFLNQVERLGRSQSEGRLGLVFQGVTSVSLGAITIMNLVDLIRAARQRERGQSGRRHR